MQLRSISAPSAPWDGPLIHIAAGSAQGIFAWPVTTNSIGASTTWPTANTAYYYPFRISSPLFIVQYWWLVGAAPGAANVDVGVFNTDGILLSNAGATAIGAATTVQSVTLGTTYLLAPGLYYMGMGMTTNTGTHYPISLNHTADAKAMGYAQMANGVSTNLVNATLATITTARPPAAYGISCRSII